MTESVTTQASADPKKVSGTGMALKSCPHFGDLDQSLGGGCYVPWEGDIIWMKLLSSAEDNLRVEEVSWDLSAIHPPCS